MTRFCIICLVLFFLSGSLNLRAQTWQSIDASNYHPLASFTQQSAGFEQHNKQFLVNKFNNSIWFGYRNEVHGFDENGTYFHCDYTNIPIFQSESNVLDFAATPNAVYVLDRFFGIHKYANQTWTTINNMSECIDISSDNDTIWVSRLSNNYFRIVNDVTSLGSNSFVKRIESKNGSMWASSSIDSFIALCENDSLNFYSPDTCALLDWTNFDMKFSQITDSIYVAGSSGISVAYNGVFTDSITPNNTIGMPTSSVFEIELDSQNNIWAVFGTAYNQITHVAYLNRSLGIWEQVYDSLNSPIDFNYRVSIELDSSDNLYVLDFDLHVLEINSLPSWLGLKNTTNSANIQIYPNPSSSSIIISGIDANRIGSNATITDVNGKQILDFEITQQQQQIDCSTLTKGVYFLRIGEENQKIIIE